MIVSDKATTRIALVNSSKQATSLHDQRIFKPKEPRKFMDGNSLYDDREDLRVYDEFEESGFLERHAYSDFVRACMDFAEHDVVPRGRYVEPLANIALGRDFMVGKVTKEDLADHRDRTWRNAVKLAEPDYTINMVTSFFTDYAFLTDSPSPEQQDPVDFLFFHWLMQVDSSLPQAFMDNLRRLDHHSE